MSIDLGNQPVLNQSVGNVKRDCFTSWMFVYSALLVSVHSYAILHSIRRSGAPKRRAARPHFFLYKIMILAERPANAKNAIVFFCCPAYQLRSLLPFNFLRFRIAWPPFDFSRAR